MNFTSLVRPEAYATRPVHRQLEATRAAVSPGLHGGSADSTVRQGNTFGDLDLVVRFARGARPAWVTEHRLRHGRASVVRPTLERGTSAAAKGKGQICGSSPDSRRRPAALSVKVCHT